MNTLCNHYKWPGTLWPHVCSVSTWGETSQRRWSEQTMGLYIQALSELLMKPCDAFQFAQCIDNVFNAKYKNHFTNNPYPCVLSILTCYFVYYNKIPSSIKLIWSFLFKPNIISQAIHWGNALLIHKNSMNLKNFMQNKFADISNVINILQINL